MNIIDKLNSESLRKEIPDFRPGDTIRVHQLIKEGDKERVQIFEGVVISRDGGGINETFTVRKVSYNVGVERIYPLHSPRVSKIEVKQSGDVRRARLYYLRELSGKAARIQEGRFIEEGLVNGRSAATKSEAETSVDNSGEKETPAATEAR